MHCGVPGVKLNLLSRVILGRVARPGKEERNVTVAGRDLRGARKSGSLIIWMTPSSFPQEDVADVYKWSLRFFKALRGTSHTVLLS